MIEGNHGIHVELTPPDGIDITTDENGNPLKAQVLYDYDSVDPESGSLVVVSETMVTLRKTALRIVPKSGETWGIRLPAHPADQETLTQFIINSDEAIMGGDSAGFVTLKIKAVDQA